MLNEIKSTLHDLADPNKVESVSRYFKTGKGEYGEGDQFLGITVPNQRLVAKEYYQNISLTEIKGLLSFDIHEYRLVALLMLVEKYQKLKNEFQQKELVDFYLSQSLRINNWDLVDTSCYKILGHYCFNQKREDLLYDLANSENLWE